MDPARLLERRKDTARGDKAIPAARLEGLLTDERNALRERVLWRMLYETAARAEEVLTLDVADLDLQFRRARTVSKGGDAEYLHWATATARLLPRLLKGRSSGPVFLADRRSPAAGSRVRALSDIDPVSGRGRLSYARAEYLFKQASKRHDPHREGWTLHQLRHSALKHLAAAGLRRAGSEELHHLGPILFTAKPEPEVRPDLVAMTLDSPTRPVVARQLRWIGLHRACHELHGIQVQFATVAGEAPKAAVEPQQQRERELAIAVLDRDQVDLVYAEGPVFDQLTEAEWSKATHKRSSSRTSIPPVT